MSNKVLFTVTSKPSKSNPGRQTVINRVTDKDGTVTDVVMGKLRKPRGTDVGYTAVVVLDGVKTVVGENYATRSQAGHAVFRAFYAEARAAKAAKRAEKAADAEKTREARAAKRVEKAEAKKREERNARRRAQRAAAKVTATEGETEIENAA